MRDRAVRITAILAALAVAAAAVAGWMWWRAAEDDGLHYAQARDEVLATAREQVVSLNTVNFTDADSALERWRQVATGALLDRLERNREADRRRAETTKTIASARIVAAAVTVLNVHSGSATVIIATEVSVSRDGAAPVVQVNRFDAELVRTGSGWRISALEVVGT